MDRRTLNSEAEKRRERGTCRDGFSNLRSTVTVCFEDPFAGSPHCIGVGGGSVDDDDDDDDGEGDGDGDGAGYFPTARRSSGTSSPPLPEQVHSTGIYTTDEFVLRCPAPLTSCSSSGIPCYLAHTRIPLPSASASRTSASIR